MDPDAIVQVLLRERVRVTALATAVLRDRHAADDVFQQVVLAGLEHRGEFREPGHVLAWALRAARHRAVDLARRKRLWLLPGDVLDKLEGHWGGRDAAGATDQVVALRHCLGRLGPPAQRMLRMRYGDGLTAAAIAGRLHRTTDAVYQSLSRTQRALRECVEREAAEAALPSPREVLS